MKVIIMFKEGTRWLPAHPGYVDDEKIANNIINALRFDGYQVGVLPALLWNEELDKYQEYKGGEDEQGV